MTRKEVTWKLKGGDVTHDCSDEMVELAKKFLIDYFAIRKKAMPGQMEDEICGEPGLFEMSEYGPLNRWHGSPFFPALALLVDEGKVIYSMNGDGNVVYQWREEK